MDIDLYKNAAGRVQQRGNATPTPGTCIISVNMNVCMLDWICFDNVGLGHITVMLHRISIFINKN